jgi:HD-GYP domain-containing protein (c-di-GMP phosphodiesterase class II)
MMYISVLVSTVLFAVFNYFFFFRRKPDKVKIIGTAESILLSPGGYLVCSELLRFFIYRFILPAGVDVSGLQGNMVAAVTLFITWLLPFVPFCILYNRLIRQQSGLGLFIYVSFLMIKFISMMISENQLTNVIFTVLLFFLWFFLFGKKISFISRHHEKIDSRLFCAASIILLILTVGLMSSVLYFKRLFHGSAVNVFSLWLDSIGILIFLLFLLLVKSNFNNMHQTILIRSAARKDAENSKKMLSAQENVIISFVEILESKSGGTGNHAKRVSEYCRVLAQSLGFSARNVENIRIASMMHDIGKLMVPNEILEKKGELTPEESEAMKQHVIYGEKMLKNASGTIMEYARIITIQHHERWNGTGYPYHLSGSRINPVSRIVSLADVFDALVSQRSYKDPWMPEKARDEIVSERGKQFAPECVDAFLKNYDKFLAVIKAFPDDSAVQNSL